MASMKQIKTFLNPTSLTKGLVHDVREQRRRMEDLKKDYLEADKWRREYHEALSALTTNMGAMFWKKDENHRYILASPTHCEGFFNMGSEPECLDYIRGKTDKELIQALYRDKGIQNTFGLVCGLTDERTKEIGRNVQYLEAGTVQGEQVLLYVNKSPFILNGIFTGTLGIAWDFSNYSDIIMRVLNRWIYSNSVSVLYLENDVFAYELTHKVKQCDIFSYINPNPTRRKRKNRHYNMEK